MQERGKTTEHINVIRHRSKIPGGEGVTLRGYKIVAVLENERTGQRQEIVAHNVVTTAGDAHYAERATTKTPTNTFNLLALSTEADTTATRPTKADVYGTVASYIAGSTKAVSAGYPAQNDTDADNSGSSSTIVSWLFSYAKGDFASGVVRGVITTTGPSSGTPLLTHFIFGTTFAKTTDDTLKVFVNHSFLGTT